MNNFCKIQWENNNMESENITDTLGSYSDIESSCQTIIEPENEIDIIKQDPLHLLEEEDMPSWLVTIPYDPEFPYQFANVLSNTTVSGETNQSMITSATGKI